MRILVISESINVEDSSASKGRVALIYSLQKCGYTLKILHFSHKEILLKGIECQMIKENRYSLLFFLSRIVRVFQRFTKIYIGNSIEQILGFSFTHSNDTNSIANSIKENQNFKPDLILTLSKGGSFRPHRAMLKLPELHGIWLAYIHDPYPFHVYPRPFDFIEKSYKAKENLMLLITEKAKFLSFPSLLLKEWMQSYFPAVELKSYIIPHQINVDYNKQNLPEFFIENQFSLLHAGNLLKERNPEFLIKAYMSFLEKNKEAKFESKLYLIGGHHHHKNTVAPFKNHENLVLNNNMDYDTTQTLENEVAVNIILESISYISPFLPGKFPNHVKANKPIIALSPNYSEVKRLLGNDYSYWSEANDVDKIESIITNLYQLWKQNPSLLKLNRMDLVDYCSHKALKEVVEALDLNK